LTRRPLTWIKTNKKREGIKEERGKEETGGKKGKKRLGRQG